MGICGLAIAEEDREMSHRIAALTHRRTRSRSQQACTLPPHGGSGVDLVDRQSAGEKAFQIRTTRANDGICVAPSGELDMSSVAHLSECLEQALEDEHVERIVVDLRTVRTLDPAALSTLLIAHRRAFDDHRELLFIRGSAPVQQVIDRVNGPFSYFP
jgi:anti-anti-sigma factor